MYIQEKEIWNILANVHYIHYDQILYGLKALHDRKIYHRDLKCANIFMFTDKRVKLGDFNVSKLAKKGLVYTQTGTPYYASPEVWQDKPYDHKADIWSLGCVIYEACTLKP
jgi:NIMA (never in mitosis gene a)-related kinase